MRKPVTRIASLNEHPNRTAILGVLSHLPGIQADDISRLAAAWRKTVFGAEARNRALSPDSPLVIDVLERFAYIEALFADDLEDGPTEVAAALKAIRDAVAAVYARPILSKGQYKSLLAPWRSVYPVEGSIVPWYGSGNTAIKTLLAKLQPIATRCHNPSGMRLLEDISNASLQSELERETAREEALPIVESHQLQRQLTALEEYAGVLISRNCATHRVWYEPTPDDKRTLTAIEDALCGLLIYDKAPDLARVLTRPVELALAVQQPKAQST